MQTTQFVQLYANQHSDGFVSRRRYQRENDVTLLEYCQRVLQEFLTSCSIPFYVTPLDERFTGLCVEDATRRGCIMSGPQSFRPFITDGVAMSLTAYAHLNDEDAMVYIAIYTAFLIYLEDIFHKDVDLVREFNTRFALHQPKGNAVLDALATFLMEMPERFGRVVANLMMTSTLNLITAVILEDELQNISVSKLVLCGFGF